MHLPLTLLDTMGGLPGLELQSVMSVLAQFFLATLRIGAFLVAVPVFGAAAVPLQVRVILAALLGVVVMGYVPVPTVESFSDLRILGVVVVELVVGLSAGLIVTIWFSAAVLAGRKSPRLLVWGLLPRLTRTPGPRHRWSQKCCRCS